MRTESTTAPIHPVNPSASEVLDCYWESWQAERTMGDIMRDIMTPVLTRRLPAEARAWVMWRFTRVW